MNILVVMRMMPDPGGELELAEDRASLEREWLDLRLNDFDDHALEEAILLKESAGGRVTAVAVGEGGARVLQMALARGADDAILLDHDPEAMISSRAIAGPIADIARAKEVNLVLTGVQASEDVFGQLAPYVGALLDWPHISSTSGLRLTDEGIAVSQERGAGATAQYVVPPPCVLGVQTASKAPRYVSGSKLREAAKAQIGRADMADGALPNASRVVGLAPPEGTAGSVDLGSDPEQVAAALVELFAARGLTGGVSA